MTSLAVEEGTAVLLLSHSHGLLPITVYALKIVKDNKDRGVVLAHFLRKMPLGDQSTVSWSAVRAMVQVTPLTWRQITASLVENRLCGVGKTHFLWAPSAQLLAGEAFRDQKSPCVCDFRLSGWELLFEFFPLPVSSPLLYPEVGARWGKQRHDSLLIKLRIHLFAFLCLTYVPQYDNL